MAVTGTFQERSGQSAAYLRFAGTQNDDVVRSEEPPNIGVLHASPREFPFRTFQPPSVVRLPRSDSALGVYLSFCRLMVSVAKTGSSGWATTASMTVLAKISSTHWWDAPR